jgi:hypothetical protein
MYAVVIVQVIVIAPEVLLNTDTTSPVANVESGIVIEPPDPTSINSPTSPVASE